jgi:signal transduction histidine kinase
MGRPISGQAARRGYQGGYLVGFVLIAVVGLRTVLFYRSNPLVPLLLLAAYTVLYALQPFAASRFTWVQSVYFPLQTGLVLALCNLRPFTDFPTALFVPLAIQIVRTFSRRAMAAWLAGLAVLMGATLLAGLPWAEGLALFLLNLAVGMFVVSYDLLCFRAEAQEAESQRLLAGLQTAYRQLEEQASQAEELAAARERNRLARELHDSVSQSIFGIRLTARSAYTLLAREPSRVPEQVERLQSLTGDTLARLRSVIAELRPPVT